jgi:hypothetical protein
MLALATSAVLLAGTGPIAYIREFSYVYYNGQEIVYNMGLQKRSWLSVH